MIAQNWARCIIWWTYLFHTKRKIQLLPHNVKPIGEQIWIKSEVSWQVKIIDGFNSFRGHQWFAFAYSICMQFMPSKNQLLCRVEPISNFFLEFMKNTFTYPVPYNLIIYINLLQILNGNINLNNENTVL